MNVRVDQRRIRILRSGGSQTGPVVYWMQRDQRVADNWALLHAQEIALERRLPLCVVFIVTPSLLNVTRRQYLFMLAGLRRVERDLKSKSINFLLLQGNPDETLDQFSREHRPSTIVTDFSPLRNSREWMLSVAAGIPATIVEVDAHNVVPCWIASPKLEFAAYTFRPKIQKLLPEFETDFPVVKRHPFPWDQKPPGTSWEATLCELPAEEAGDPIQWLEPGEKEGQKNLDRFLEGGLSTYHALRNDPTSNGQSNLSPYLHFGQLSAQRVVYEVRRLDRSVRGREAFLEEMIVRRELSDNFCFYNPFYDSAEGFPAWARKSLDGHRDDKREFVYGIEDFEQARTHDDLWNAAQREMVRSGKMHGYMRMYWAKKILEWSPSPEEALRVAIDLNDRFELDGRDPNGYAGIAWSIGGVHDRAWFDRPVFGKIRYMNRNGCRSKFNINAYIAANRE